MNTRPCVDSSCSCRKVFLVFIVICLFFCLKNKSHQSSYACFVVTINVKYQVKYFSLYNVVSLSGGGAYATQCNQLHTSAIVTRNSQRRLKGRTKPWLSFSRRRLSSASSSSFIIIIAAMALCPSLCSHRCFIIDDLVFLKPLQDFTSVYFGCKRGRFINRNSQILPVFRSFFQSQTPEQQPCIINYPENPHFVGPSTCSLTGRRRWWRKSCRISDRLSINHQIITN